MCSPDTFVSLGEGTTFSLYFPENVDAAKAAARKKVDLRLHVPHDKTILFVDAQV